MSTTRRIKVIGFLLAACASATPAAAERLVISISRHQVLVNSSFDGTSIVLFGTVEPDSPTARRRSATYDLVTTVTGPKQTVVARHKERVLGIWVNMNSRAFVNVPSYLGILANRPLDQITNPETLRQQQIGFKNVLLPQQIGPDVADVVRDDPFRVNFIRLKSEHELYLEQTNAVTFITPTVFRAGITLPAISPVGNYDVDVKLFGDGVLLARTTSAFEVIKVGFEQFVATAAKDYGVLYGLVTAIMALATGWFASVVFRRD
jgi:uncharacterized protein (TIGR02186 family)